MGEAGVNVDKNALELADNELQRAQNAISDVNKGRSTLRKRAGLLAFNTDVITEGTVLGGADLPVNNTSSEGFRNLYVGRGPD
jgi:hypothetical protein